MKTGIQKRAGVLFLALLLWVSMVTTVIVQSRAFALTAPQLGFQQEQKAGNEENWAWISSSEIGPSGNLYQAGSFAGQFDFDPSAGTDVRSSETQAGFIRVLTSTGAYVRTLVLADDGDGGESWIQDLVFNDDKSSYYIVGAFHGGVDFDVTAGQAIRTATNGYTNGFIAKYLSSNNQLSVVQTLQGTGDSGVSSIAYSTVDDVVAIGGYADDGADPNPTATSEAVDIDAPSAGFMSTYSANLVYDQTRVYDTGNTEVTSDVYGLTYNTSWGALAYIVATDLVWNSEETEATFSMQFDPVGNSDARQVSVDEQRDSSAIVYYDNEWGYGGMTPIVLDVNQLEHSEHVDVEGLQFDASDNLYMTGTVYTPNDHFDFNFEEDGEDWGTDVRDVPQYDTSMFVTRLAPGEGYYYDTSFVYGIDDEGDDVNVDDVSDLKIDSEGNVFIGGQLYGSDDDGLRPTVDVNPSEITDMRQIDEYTNFIMQLNDDLGFSYIVTSGHTNSSYNRVMPNTSVLALDASGNIFASTYIDYVSDIQDEETCEMEEGWTYGISTAKFSATGSATSSWLDFTPPADQYIEGCDADGDGISDADEGNILGGDANGDETPDRTQEYVSAFTSPVTNKPVALEVDGACTLSDVSVKTEAQAGTDTDHYYPLGLLDFTADCGEDGFTSTIKQIYYDPPAGEFVVRKVLNGSYQTIDSATVTRTTINGRDVLVVEYEITDGGVLDADGEENGIIVDPAGPALAGAGDVVAAPASAGVPNTGLASVSLITPIVIGLTGLGLIGLVSLERSRHKK